MEKTVIPIFDCFSEPATLGPRWERWLMSFELYADGKGHIIGSTTTPEVKQRRRALMLHLAGPDVQEIFLTLPDTGAATDFDAAKTALNKYFVPQKNAAFARQTFHQVVQKEGETVLQFVTRLRRAARDCDFGGEKDNQIRDAVLSKCKSDYVRRKLLEAGDELTLAKAMKVADKCEKVESQMAALSVKGKTYQSDTTVNMVSDRKPKPHDKSSKPKKWTQQSKHQRQENQSVKSATTTMTTKGACYRCGRTGHFGRDPKCPARGQTCQKCSGRDHFAKVCKTKSKPTVNQIGEQHLDSEPSHDYAFLIHENTYSNKMKVTVGGIDLHMLIDSGATSNVIDEHTWESLKNAKIKCESRVAPPNRKLWAYGADQALSLKGLFSCEASISGKSVPAEFIVIKGKGVPLLGKVTAMELGVLKIGVDAANSPPHTTAVASIDERTKSGSTQFHKQFPDVFKAVGKLKTEQVKLHIDPSVKPVAQPLRRTPFNLRSRVEEKIRELEDLDIIERVDGPTPWVNPVVTVPKPNGDIRLCLDMRRANDAIIRGRHPIPTVDELLQTMNGSKFFSKLDLKWGYHQLELDNESRGITTFVTHCGLYQYKRLLFGVSSASEQYQYMIAKTLAGLEGVENISDDIIVHASDKKTHDNRVFAVLRRLEEVGLTLNQEKCQFNMSRLVFMGILLSEKGIGPTQERVRAVAEFREPENVSEIRSFLGLVGFSSRFIPNFATVSDPLRKLTRKGIPFQFGPHQRTAFNSLKESLANATTLAYYDKNAPTKVIADASPVGLGAVLIQEQHDGLVPVCYASRSLTDCERRYSQTEKEALSLVWACERFHAFIYGRSFELLTDHKPLEAIYGPRSKPCARVERWVLRLQPYEYKVVYIPGRDNIADALSRLSQEKIQLKHDHGAEDYVRFVAISATPSAMTTKQVESASAEDKELAELREAIRTGFFENCKAYAPIAGELCVIGQLILRGTRIVLPQKLRQQALALAHEGHLGIVGTKQNLRTKVWWPGMEKGAEKFCRSCHGCQIVARPDPPEPLRPTTLPDGPWQDLATDLLGPFPSGHSVLVVIDYYSRYYEYQILSSTTADKVIDSLEEIFSRHGLPVTLKSDNGPQFRSHEFREFCEENGIDHVKVTAKWAQANGEVERQNDSIMKRIRIAQAEGQNWRKELRKYVTKYRATEHPATRKTPAELLFKRKMRGKLPVFQADNHSDLEVRDRDAENKGKAKLYTDARRNAKYSEVEVGDQVLVRQEKTNKFSTPFNPEPFTIVNKTGNSVIVASPKGAQYSRNTSHVKKFMQTAHDADMPLSDPAIQPSKMDHGSAVPEQILVSPTQSLADTNPVATPPTVVDKQSSPHSARPKRQCGMHPKYKDFVLN